MDTYTVRVVREDGLWSAIVHDLPEGASAGYDFERFSDIHDGVRDAVVDLVEHDDFELQWASGAGGGGRRPGAGG